MKEEFLILRKYVHELSRAKDMNEAELEGLILILSNEVEKNEFGNKGPITSWIMLLRNLQLKKEVTSKEEYMLERAEQGKLVAFRPNFEENASIRKRLKFDSQAVK